MELLILLNTLIIGYLIIMGYQLTKMPKNITYDSKHHFISHLYILAFLIIGIDAHAFYNTLYPLAFAIGNILWHLAKENNRLISSNYWTPDLPEEL